MVPRPYIQLPLEPSKGSELHLHLYPISAAWPRVGHGMWPTLCLLLCKMRQCFHGSGVLGTIQGHGGRMWPVRCCRGNYTSLSTVFSVQCLVCETRVPLSCLWLWGIWAELSCAHGPASCSPLPAQLTSSTSSGSPGRGSLHL